VRTIVNNPIAGLHEEAAVPGGSDVEMCGVGDDEGVLHDDGHTVMIEELQDSALKPLYENLPHLECVYWVME
jgi:hypothetical protein